MLTTYPANSSFFIFRKDSQPSVLSGIVLYLFCFFQSQFTLSDPNLFLLFFPTDNKLSIGPLRLSKDFRMVRNRKGGWNLTHNGYTYRKKAEFLNTINWVCSFSAFCKGRLVTDSGGFLKKIGKQSHSHRAVAW
jgi:hypothetical protein